MNIEFTTGDEASSLIIVKVWSISDFPNSGWDNTKNFSNKNKVKLDFPELKDESSESVANKILVEARKHPDFNEHDVTWEIFL